MSLGMGRNLFGFTLALQMLSPITKIEEKELLYSLDNEEAWFYSLDYENKDEVVCSYSILSLHCP